MIDAVDLDGSGSIDFEEFLQMIINKQGSSRDLHAEMSGGFQLMDKDGDGYISLQVSYYGNCIQYVVLGRAIDGLQISLDKESQQT